MMPIMAKSGNACYYCSIWSAFCFAWLALLPMCECVVEKTDFITCITYFPPCILYTSLLTPTFPNQLFSLSSLKRCTLVHLSNRSSCTYSLCYPTGNRVSHCSREIILIRFMSDSTKVAAVSISPPAQTLHPQCNCMHPWARCLSSYLLLDNVSEFPVSRFE